ncbi:MAG: TIGR02147 family protein [Oligoflexia bacterium]|nr:TIGR02147 family protein [Oligoflexia bacterium]
MNTESSDYRDVLRTEYARRRNRNPSYSLRAFARDLDIAYSRLNEVINAKRGISAVAADRLAMNLGLSETEKNIFVAQVEASHGRSNAVRNRAQARARELRAQTEQNSIQLDAFEMISHWYHYAILELPALKEFQADPQWIADRLGISRTEAEGAISRLFRVGLLRKTKTGFEPARDFTFSTTDIPSAGLKRHHEQILAKATDAIHFQDIHERDLSAVTVAIDRKDIPKAKEMLKTFRRQFMREMEKSADRDAVYSLALQFFRIDKTPRGKNE